MQTLSHAVLQVIAMGRNEAALQRLVQLDPARVAAVRLSNDCNPAETLNAALWSQGVRRQLSSL